LTKPSSRYIIHIVNNFYSSPEIYYNRWLTPTLQAAVEAHPVVVLTGARQVGKSTLLRNAAPFRDWRFRTMDDYDVLRQAREHPEALWAGTNQIVLDEVQKVPQMLSAIKQMVDANPGQMRFVLSGSANLLLMQQVSESLAGRAVYFILSPLTHGEQKQTPAPDWLTPALRGEWPDEGQVETPPPDFVPFLLRGQMPSLLTLPDPQSWVRWWDGYVTTYLERDLRQISQIDSLLDFRRVMELLALRTGQLLNQSDVSRDAGLSQPTIHRYLNLLETTHLFERLPAYTSSRTPRLLKAPKVMWADPGLAVFLAGYFSEEDLRRARELGSFFETFIYHHLQALTSLMVPAGRLYVWRTQKGQEVDFVLEHGRKVLGIEVKLTTRPQYGDAAGLRAFLDDYPEAAGGILVHTGQNILRLDDKIVAVPWTMLTG
jgi:predicted AAA+ superfamily ATPase